MDFTYTGDSGKGGGLWWDLPKDIDQNPSVGTSFFEDFLAFQPIAASGLSGRWYGYIDTGDTIKMVSGANNGVVRIATAATDNNGPVLGVGDAGSGGVANPWEMLLTGGKKLWAEARVKLSSALITGFAAFVGFAEEARAINNGLIADSADDGAIAAHIEDVDQVGFMLRNVSTGTPVWEAIYKKAGQTTSVGTVTVDAELAAWVLLGVKFDPDLGTLTWFVDGEAIRTVNIADLTTTLFPSGESMTFYAAIKETAGTAAVKYLDVDWVKIAQLR